MFQRILFGTECLFYAVILAGLLSTSAETPSTGPENQARRFTRTIEFDYVNWTLNAFEVKLGQIAIGTPFTFKETTRHQIMLNYLGMMDQILQDEYFLQLMYTDPAIQDPETSSTELHAELDDLYARQRKLAPLAESILQEHISAVLAEIGLTTGGQPLPPVAFHISPLPYHLVISPRDRIQEDAAISLVPDLPVDRQAILESQVDAALDVSSLVVPVGGIGSYPTMVMRTSDLNWLIDAVAHEWVHNWLTLRPLGLNYDASPELRTMNETAASIAGGEIMRLVLERYYPERIAMPTVQIISLSVEPPPPLFDFREEMHTTRVHVDELLAAGKIEEAEAYMEQRRLFFWANGYGIRKLNQAYFAFYGAYADVPGGAAGEDPVGPAVRALHDQSSSLAEFLKTIARMTSFQQLQDILAR